ncbi:MAG: class II aldolase/adducin family protein [Chloroflexota bacterium]
MTGANGFDVRFGAIGWEMRQAGRRLGTSALIGGAEGNLSARLADGTLLITAAGVRKNELHPRDLLVVSANGSVIRGDRQPSTELALHLAAYAACPEAGAAVHAHPIAATAFAAAEKQPNWTALAESINFLGPVGLVPYAPPGTSALGDALTSAMGQSRALLLAHHGALTLGPTMEIALQRMELLERLCAIELQATGIGGVQPLPELEIQRLLP